MPDKKPFAETLDELLENFEIKEKQRVYKVIANDQTRFTVANSKGNAALTVCDVEALKPGEVKDATIRVLEEKVRGLEKPESRF